MINACDSSDLRGTVLLAHEGINFFLAGTQHGVDDFLAFLDSDVRFLDIPLKISHTDYQPFNRMNVRLKKEIISIGMDEVQPAVLTGDSIAPEEFKQWLDDGKTVTILDTRNDYEIRLGTFENAMDLDITSFRAFPAAVNAMPEELKDTPVVMFCTGGIRCEKASVVMLEAGFKDVRQLEGGILGYFEQVGGSQAALDMAKAYSLERFAFGRQIGSYQAIKHKLADMYIAVTLAKSNCYYGAWALSSESAELPLAAATARVSATKAFQLCSKENIQTHGGNGFTWEYDCHLFYKRSKVLSVLLGSEATWKEKLVPTLEKTNTLEKG